MFAASSEGGNKVRSNALTRWEAVDAVVPEPRALRQAQRWQQALKAVAPGSRDLQQALEVAASSGDGGNLEAVDAVTSEFRGVRQAPVTVGDGDWVAPDVRSKLRGGSKVWRRWEAVDAVAPEVCSKLRVWQQGPEVVEGSICRDEQAPETVGCSGGCGKV